MSGTYPVVMGDRGRLVVPAEVRTRLKLHAGSPLLLLETPADNVRAVHFYERQGYHILALKPDGRALVGPMTSVRLEKRLDPRRFQRVHRSTIVNLDLVRQVKPHTNGECFLVLDSGGQVKVSRSYRDVVARFVH